jgi:hypothetical protein
VHHHVLAGAIHLSHSRDAVGAECLVCDTVLSVWAGPPELYGIALSSALDRIALHCGEHGIETVPDEIRAVLLCLDE